MTISDAIVIYLTCGSPFAVHVLMTAGELKPTDRALHAAVNFAAWPAVAAQYLFKLIRGGRIVSLDGHPGANSGLALLLQEMENAANVPETDVSVFAVRDVFERYTGLASAYFQSGGRSGRFEIFEISGHSSPDVASACLSRRTRERLAAHLNMARAEFVELMDDLARVSEYPQAIASLAKKVANAVNDEAAYKTLQRSFRSSTIVPNRGVPPEENDQLWSPEQASTLAN